MNRLAVFLCSFAYIGFFPVAPGTAGSVAGVAVYLLMRRLHALPALLPLIILFFAVGVAFGGAAERALGRVDPGPVVIDEVMGMLLSVWLVPVNWAGLLVGFLLFRALDVLKPYPARNLERLPGGLGMMADDAMAAVYANVAMQLLYYVAPRLVS